MPVKPAKAMVLAAGLGVRMRPLTDRMPKPLVRVAGRALLDHVLDKLGDAGVSDAVVNVHYLPDQIIDHTAARARPRVIISDERDEVLGTGGAVVTTGSTACTAGGVDAEPVDEVAAGVAAGDADDGSVPAPGCVTESTLPWSS